MQTFLPYPSFQASAMVLDRQRLGKQRVEAKQIYLALTDPTYGWQNHPAVKMWRGHQRTLAYYGLHICQEWRNRGYNDSLWEFFWKHCEGRTDEAAPSWLGNHLFHKSHQSNLIRKYPDWYTCQFPGVPNDLPYVWPVP